MACPLLHMGGQSVPCYNAIAMWQIIRNMRVTFWPTLCMALGIRQF